MALLGAVVGVLAVLLAHGVRSPAASGGGAVGVGADGPVVSTPSVPTRSRRGSVGRGAAVSGTRGGMGAGGEVTTRGEVATRGRVKDGRGVPGVGAVRGARVGEPAMKLPAAASPTARAVASVVAAQAAVSEFGFER